MGYDTETEICILNKKDVTMSRGKKDREEITNTEEVKETEVSDEMEKAEDSEKAEDDKKPEETKETDDKPVSLYVQEPFIDPSGAQIDTDQPHGDDCVCSNIDCGLYRWRDFPYAPLWSKYDDQRQECSRKICTVCGGYAAFGCTEIHTGYQVQGQ